MRLLWIARENFGESISRENRLRRKGRMEVKYEVQKANKS